MDWAKGYRLEKTPRIGENTTAKISMGGPRENRTPDAIFSKRQKRHSVYPIHKPHGPRLRKHSMDEHPEKTIFPFRSTFFQPSQDLFGKRQKMFSAVAFVLLCRWSMKINRTKRNSKTLNTMVVVGPGYRTMAFRDQLGRLRNFWNGQILPLPAHILDPEN
jgi:hypothetical protein